MPKQEEHDVQRKSAIVFGAVSSIVFSILSLLIVGWVLDRWLKTAPWLLVVGVILGAVIGFYQFIRQISRIS
jgi:F0F1-type ATP synthase assembly protein I